MSTSSTGAWQAVGKLSEMRDDEARVLVVGSRQIAVCRVAGKLYAIDNICSHEFACLSDGLIEDDEIECPLHQARFHIPTGKALTEPATVALETFEVRVEGDIVLVRVEQQ